MRIRTLLTGVTKIQNFKRTVEVALPVNNTYPKKDEDIVRGCGEERLRGRHSVGGNAT